jgi:hypothetical protein
MDKKQFIQSCACSTNGGVSSRSSGYSEDISYFSYSIKGRFNGGKPTGMLFYKRTNSI